MGELDLDNPQMQITVGEIIATIMHLDPALTLTVALSEAQNEIIHLKERLRKNESILKTIVQERDALIEKNK